MNSVQNMRFLVVIMFLGVYNDLEVQEFLNHGVCAFETASLRGARTTRQRQAESACLSPADLEIYQQNNIVAFHQENERRLAGLEECKRKREAERAEKAKMASCREYLRGLARQADEEAAQAFADRAKMQAEFSEEAIQEGKDRLRNLCYSEKQIASFTELARKSGVTSASEEWLWEEPENLAAPKVEGSRAPSPSSVSTTSGRQHDSEDSSVCADPDSIPEEIDGESES